MGTMRGEAAPDFDVATLFVGEDDRWPEAPPPGTLLDADLDTGDGGGGDDDGASTEDDGPPGVIVVHNRSAIVQRFLCSLFPSPPLARAPPPLLGADDERDASRRRGPR